MTGTPYSDNFIRMSLTALMRSRSRLLRIGPLGSRLHGTIRAHVPAFLLALLCACPLTLAAQEVTSASAETTAADTAPVVVDGRPLFVVSGFSAYPAKERAGRIRDAIIKTARSSEVTVENLSITPLTDRVQLRAGEIVLLNVVDADADREGITRQTLAEVYQFRIANAISNYREDRSPEQLLRSAAIALAYLLGFLFVGWLINRVFRWLEARAERRLKRNLRDIEAKSQRLVHAGRLWLLLAALFRAIRLGAIVLLAYITLTSVLDLFPWTRSIADGLLQLFLSPLRELWGGVVEATPGLVFILVLFLVLRYLLNLMKVLFRGVETGSIQLVNFDPDWAMPTFKIVRVVLIALGIVIAYPYIPGSDSLAFKGISVFVGVLLSIGSSSVISNTFAGLSMIYRRAFKVGDRVRIDDVIGFVREIRLQTTQVVTAKNEAVVLPNSNIMHSNVINYSQLAKERGLILHTTVGIGYDTPWRQVEAMLLAAADRTDGLEKEPTPFVLQCKLGDFAIDYEINAYCSNPDRILGIYSDLHAHIQDVFNENGVQIMSPAYVADPEEPKVVPPDQWKNPPTETA